VFDLDGTLTDPSPGIIGSYHYALDKLGIVGISDDTIRSLIGPPLRHGFKSIMPDADEERIELAVATYRERFAEWGLYANELVPHVREVFEALRGQSRRVYVVTSKLQHFAELTIEHFKLTDLVDGIYGGSLDGRLDDKAEIVKLCVEAERLDPCRAVMIGDRSHDYHAAAAHGIRTIGVHYGFAHPGELEALPLLAIISSLDELLH
jgi:phosphoglycolate phosphatase